ncbi:MAG: hypothetical protein U5J83_13220 [Bryobacterales bacterium]|nr:hypothetical protein [Bryobacterales bacterium]
MRHIFRSSPRRRPFVAGTLLALFAVALPIAASLSVPKFYPDDPLWQAPAPRHVEDAKLRKLSDYYEFLVYPFAPPGELNGLKKDANSELLYFEAQAVNTLGEVPANSWYENRNYFQPMSKAEIQAGPSLANAPSTNGKWRVVAAKNEGITPGFTIVDDAGRRYVVKFDPLGHPELATSADTISSKLFYALGYFVPENYLVAFSRDQLEVDPKAKLKGTDGEERSMSGRDITEILLKVPRMADGRYRASASFYIAGKPLGPHRYFGTRSDDPNDIYPHEHRRDQRGLWVACAWLGHDDSRDINSHDSLVQENGLQFVKHYLIDFGSSLGSASARPNSPRSGNFLFSWDEVTAQAFTFGLNVPKWARAKYPHYPSVGLFEWRTFDPETWRPEYINPAFHNALPDDAFWSAKQVMAISDDQIRWAVDTGEYSNAAARDWVVECLIQRRNKIGTTFFAKLLPLDRFRIEDGSIRFDDLGAKHGHYPPRQYQASWATFDNHTRQSVPIPGANNLAIPASAPAAQGTYLVVRLVGDHAEKDVQVTIRREATGWKVVGVERGWAGKSKLKFAHSAETE